MLLICIFNTFQILSHTEVALYKLRLKQEGLRRPSSTSQTSSQVRKDLIFNFGNEFLLERHSGCHLTKCPKGGSVNPKDSHSELFG